VVLVVEILNNKSTYNTLELTSGRMAKVARGDVVVGRARPPQGAVRLFRAHSRGAQARRHHPDAEHRRRARHLRFGHPDKGKPFDCKVLGAVLTFPYLGERIGVPAKAGYKPLDYDARSTCAACRWWRSPAPAWRPARPRPPPPSSRACAIAA
jgi:hypothetical protein